MGTLLCAVFSSLLVIFPFPIRISASIRVTYLQIQTVKTNSLVSTFVSFLKSSSYPALTMTNIVTEKRKLQIQKLVGFFFCTVHTTVLGWKVWFAFMEQKRHVLAKKTHSASKQKEKMIEVTGQWHQTFIKTYFLVSLSYAAVWSNEELAVYLILAIVFL